jgi:SAM-dependent methyltransferase
MASRRLIELVIQHTSPNSRILEAGCGTAGLSMILADAGFNVTALDLTEDVLNFAKTKICLQNIPLNFVQGDILNLSAMFDKGYFDTVCHSGVMEHFSDEQIIRSLAEQKAVSRKVIFNVPNNRTTPSPQLFGDERLMNNRKWVSLIKEAGFNKITVFGGYDVPSFFYFFLPGVFFVQSGSFWWKWFSRHSIFLCE